MPGLDPRPIILCSSCAPPGRARQLPAVRADQGCGPAGLPSGAAMISPAVEPSFCGRLGNTRGATDSCTKMLLAWGLSPPRFFRPGRPYSGHCGQKGAQDLYRKCCRKPKPPSPGGPPSHPARPAGPESQRPAPAGFCVLLSWIVPAPDPSISATFSLRGVTTFSYHFCPKRGSFLTLTLALVLVLALALNSLAAYLIM